MNVIISLLTMIFLADVNFHESSETRLAWIQQESKSNTKTDQESKTDDRDFVVESERAKLKVRLHLPEEGKGPFPAIVIVHGSGRVTRKANPGFAKMFVKMGFAVATYDKRGVGESTGHYMGIGSTKLGTRMLELLAEDAAAVQQWLRKRDDIDAARVGFAGGSQAGWIMPLAADRADKPAFIVAISGPTVSVGEENFYSRETRDKTTSEAIIKKANELTKDYTGRRGYDPRSVVKSMKTPCFWIYGDLDESIPVDLCISELDKLIAEGKKNHTYFVVPGGNHNLRNVKTGKRFQTGKVFRKWFIENGILK